MDRGLVAALRTRPREAPLWLCGNPPEIKGYTRVTNRIPTATDRFVFVRNGRITQPFVPFVYFVVQPLASLTSRSVRCPYSMKFFCMAESSVD